MSGCGWATLLVSAACFYTSHGEDGFLLRRMIFLSHQLLRMSVVNLGGSLGTGLREWVSGSAVLCAPEGRALVRREGSQALRFSQNLSSGEGSLAPAEHHPLNCPPPPRLRVKAPGERADSLRSELGAQTVRRLREQDALKPTSRAVTQRCLAELSPHFLWEMCHLSCYSVRQ